MLLHYDSWIKNYSVIGNDGAFGTVRDALFDEDFWTIRYIVVKTGVLFTKETLYISPASIEKIDIESHIIRVNISQEQAAKAPLLGDEPISRESERSFGSYYGLNPYWMGGSVWGSGMNARGIINLHKETSLDDDVYTTEREEKKVHKAKDVIGDELATEEESFGKIEDILFEEDTFKVRYFIADTQRFFPRKKVLISTDWITSVNWVTGRMEVSVTKDQIENAPTYFPGQPITREIEEELYQHFLKNKYW
ncbi:PRC-barrel domain-containing protein [Evansella sp. AB-rgal1]|uniref:PRC-barrel domain containing protein n=1 Tax=Evansella sp. AB-rgal1 TaxID=3242696 RepID=UPI00359D8DF2